MRKVGDGTGMKDFKGEQANTADQDAKPNSGSETGVGDKGSGAELAKGGSRNSPLKKG